MISPCTSPACWCRTSGVDVQCAHTKRVTCPARGPVVYTQRVRAQYARQEPSPTARERKCAHAPPKTHPMHMYFCTLAWQIHKGSHMWRLCGVESTRDQVHTTSQRQAGERRGWNFSEKLRIDAWFTHQHHPDTHRDQPFKLIIQSKLTSKDTPNRIGQVQTIAVKELWNLAPPQGQKLLWNKSNHFSRNSGECSMQIHAMARSHSGHS